VTPHDPTSAFARAVSALVREHDVTDILATLLGDTLRATSAAAAGVLISMDNGDLELLAASSHRASELELYQAQEASGPCVDAIVFGQPISQDGRRQITARWPVLGTAIVAAGYDCVHAYPMRWGEHTVGAMNLFHTPAQPAPDLSVLGPIFADLATLTILAPEHADADALYQGTTHALAGRAVIEQAKGIIAYQENLSIDAAYDRLRQLAQANRQSLTHTANQLLEAAQNRT